jgi:16S rRNA C1402 (ribose-2'-O) methylase RsmI
VPIGNLRDITLRAIDTLSSVAAIVCEDTRVTRRLLHACGLAGDGDTAYENELQEEEQEDNDGADEDGVGRVSHAGPPSANPCSLVKRSEVRPAVGSSSPASSSSSTSLPSDERAPSSFTPILLSYTHQNAKKRAGEIIVRLRRGENVALVTDAGTPSISDPGYLLVHAVRSAGMRVSPVPGACAAVAAVSASGWDVHAHYSSGRSGSAGSGKTGRGGRSASPFGAIKPQPSSTSPASAAAASSPVSSAGFVFLGFLPARGAERKSLLETIASKIGTCDRTVVLYESPVRVAETLRDLAGAAEGWKREGGDDAASRRKERRRDDAGSGDAQSTASASASASSSVSAPPTAAPPRRVLIFRELTKSHEEMRVYASLSAAALDYTAAEEAGKRMNKEKEKGRKRAKGTAEKGDDESAPAPPTPSPDSGPGQLPVLLGEFTLLIGPVLSAPTSS